jgi:hypothetical protein
MSKEIKFIKPITCSECCHKIKQADRDKRIFLEERSKLERCKGCHVLRDLERLRKDE